MVDRLMSSYGASERHACRVLCVTRGTYRYRSCLDPRTELRMRIREIAQARVRYGYRKIRVLLNREGWDVGKYLVYRLCKVEGLMLKRMKPAGRRKAARQREEKLKPTAPDPAWSMDFVADPSQDGTRFRSLTIVDVYTRSGGDRSRAEVEGRRCGAYVEQARTVFSATTNSSATLSFITQHSLDCAGRIHAQCYSEKSVPPSPVLASQRPSPRVVQSPWSS